MTRDEVASLLIARVLRREGGVADVSDGKGITRFGQTSDWCRDFNLPLPATRDEAAANYRVWLDRTQLVEVCDFADALADAVIDFAVNSGQPRSIRALQSAIGVRPDGVIGPETIAKLSIVNRAPAAASVIADRNAWFYGLLADQPEKFGSFARGWARRMGEQIRGLVA